MPNMNKKAKIEAQKLLAELLPAARADAIAFAADPELSFEVVSGVAKAALAYMREHNFAGIHIYPAPLGGFHCDLILKKVPPGVANSFGSPVGAPLPTREEALQYGRRMLTGLLSAVLKHAPKPEDAPPVFEFFGMDLPIDDALLAAAEKARDNIAKKLGRPLNPNDINEMLGGMVAEHFPGGFTGGFDPNRPFKEKAQITICIHLAALCGVFRYPPLPNGTPSAHKPHETRQ